MSARCAFVAMFLCLQLDEATGQAFGLATGPTSTVSNVVTSSAVQLSVGVEAMTKGIDNNVAEKIAKVCAEATSSNVPAEAKQGAANMIRDFPVSSNPFFDVRIIENEVKPVGLIFKEHMEEAYKEVHMAQCFDPGFAKMARDKVCWKVKAKGGIELATWKTSTAAVYEENKGKPGTPEGSFLYKEMMFNPEMPEDVRKRLVEAANAHVTAVLAMVKRVAGVPPSLVERVAVFGDDIPENVADQTATIVDNTLAAAKALEVQTNASIDVEGQVSLIDEQVAAGFAEQQTTGAEAASIDGLVEVQTHASIDGEGQVSLIDEQVAAGLAEQNTTGAEAASIDGLVEDQTHACTDGEGQVSDEQVAAGLAEQQTTGAEGASIDGEGQIAQTAEGSAADTPTNPKFRGENDVSGQGATSLHPVH